MLQELAAKADELFALREQRLALNREADKIKEQEGMLEADILQTLFDNDARGVAGQKVQLTLDSVPTPSITDADAFWEHLIASRSTDLIQQRLSAPAVKARWEAGEVIPGVEAIAIRKLRLHKL